jgi:hypothetical protein
VFFSDGDPKGISWLIQTGDKTVEQYRDQTGIYMDKVNSEQSKYIALHVGIFWCIGTFIIKNEDEIIVNLDSKSMYEHLTKDTANQDSFIDTRTGFIKQLIVQRKLKINYHQIESKDNLASKLLQKRNGT